MTPKRAALLAAALAAAGLAAAVVFVVLALGDGSGEAYRGSRPPGRFLLPEFALRNHDGGRVRSTELRGKALVVTFLESRCRESCPVIAARVGRALRLLSPEERRRVVSLAISTHPGDDTPASVRGFLRRHRAENELLYLIGSERELRPVWKAFQILAALDTGDADVHSAGVRVYDRQSVWVSTLHAGVDLTAENLRHDLLAALAE